MKVRVPIQMIKDLCKYDKISKKDKENLELYLGSWSSPKGYGILNSESFDSNIFNRLQEMLDKINKKTNQQNFLKRQLKLLRDILTNPEGATPKKLEDLESILREYIKNANDFIIFQKIEDSFYPYLVTGVEYEQIGRAHV